MINTSDIAEIIKNPELAGSFSNSDLAEIRDKFAYCSTLHLIWLKGLSLSNDLQFEEHLRYAAAHVMDRERMYYLIHSGTESTAPAVVLTKAVETDAGNLVQEKPVVEEKEKIKVAEISDKAITTESEPEEEKHHSLLESAPDLVEIAYVSDLNEEIVESPENPILSEIEIIEKPKLAEYDLPLPEKEPVAEEPDLSKLSFIEWLQYKQNKKLPETKGAAISENAIEQSKDVAKKDHEITEKPVKTKKTGLSRSDVDALLNKFITEEPSISRPQTAFFSPTKTAKQSLEEVPDLVTETLARIYVLQKNYVKAIQAYEQLSLVYPEKKPFFATQIQKIRDEQQKNTKH